MVYDAGFAEIPGAVFSTCIRMVMRAMSNPTGLARESIDDYTAQRTDDRGAVYLAAEDRAALKRHRRSAFSISVGSSNAL